MKAKDTAEQLAEIEKRRLGGKMSYEEAILSREKIAEENRRKVAEMKEKVSVIKRLIFKSQSNVTHLV